MLTQILAFFAIPPTIIYYCYQKIFLKWSGPVPENLLDKKIVKFIWDTGNQAAFFSNIELKIGFLIKKYWNSNFKPVGNFLKKRRELYNGFAGDISAQIEEDCTVETIKVENVVCFIVYPGVYMDRGLENIPKEKLFSKTVFYYHGGGHAVGKPSTTHLALLQRMAKRLNRTVIACDYAKSPEYSFNEDKKCAFYDCWVTTRYFVNKFQINDYVLSGDSAGGNLTFSVALKAVSCSEIDLYALPILVAPIYPIYNMCYFNSKSHLDADYPTLSRKMIILYELAYMVGEVDPEILNAIQNDLQRSETVS